MAEAEEQDSFDIFQQDLFSKIRHLEKSHQHYTLARFVAGFLKEVKAYKINVTEYEYYLKKHYKAEKNENDLSAAELDALLNSYLTRLKEILDHRPPQIEALEINDNTGGESQVNEEEIIEDILSKITSEEGPSSQNSASTSPLDPSQDPDLHDVIPLKHMAADRPIKPFKFKPDE